MCILHEEVGGATERLAALGIPSAVLRRAVEEGQAARLTCTLYDPPSLSGYLAWGRTVRSLREQLVPAGWEASDRANFSTVVGPDREVVLAVATGDEGTGNPRITPKTRHPRGPLTHAAVEQNSRQYDLFRPTLSPEVAIPHEATTWLLLISESADEVRYELSLPASIGDDDRVETWRERIFFPPIPTEPQPSIEVPEEPIDVPVRRRGDA